MCKDCLSKPELSNEEIVRGTGGKSEESNDVNDLHDNNDNWQLEADNSDERKDEDEVEDRMCKWRWHCLC